MTASDQRFTEACSGALDTARAILRAHHLPSLGLELVEWFDAAGSSIGVAALLAFLEAYTRTPPPLPVIAIGGLRHQVVQQVDSLVEKQYAVEREVQGQEVQLVDPTTHGDVRSVIQAAFGDAPLVPDREFLHIEGLIQQTRADPDHERASQLLRSADRAGLPEADRARLKMELGVRLRHLGLTEDARRAHDDGLALLAQNRSVLGMHYEQFQSVQFWQTRIDEFDLPAAEHALAEMLRLPFIEVLTEVHCRGALAQAVAMAGRPEEAVSIRSTNLPLHNADTRLLSELPRTLCNLALDSARARDLRRFREYSRRLSEETRPGDVLQWRFNSSAIVRGLVANELYRDALEWAAGSGKVFGIPPPQQNGVLLEGGITGYPEVSIARALVRAHRRTGNAEEALRLADRVPNSVAVRIDLVAWLCEVVHIEAGLALGDLGRWDESRRFRRAGTEADDDRTSARLQVS